MPDAVDVDADRAAARIAASVTEARRQLAPQRRCENFLRDGKAKQAFDAAAEGVNLYPRSTLARGCLLAAQLVMGTAADSVLSVAGEMLRVDTASFYALQGAAQAYDALKDKDRAAAMWTRLHQVDTVDVDLGEKIVAAMLYNGNSSKAEPLIARLSDNTPDHMGLLRLRRQVLFTNKSWKETTRVGAILLATDSASMKARRSSCGSPTRTGRTVTRSAPWRSPLAGCRRSRRTSDSSRRTCSWCAAKPWMA